MGNEQTVWKWIREGGANVADPGPSITAGATGAGFPDVDAEVAALAKIEAEFRTAFEDADKLAGEEFVSSADRDKVAKRLVLGYNARRKARLALADKIEDEDTRKAAEESSDVEIAEGAAMMLEGLALVEQGGDKVARAEFVKSAARDNNPHRRQSPIPATAGRRPGGQLTDQLRRAVENIGQADYYVLPGDQHAAYFRGETARDVFGNEVPPGLPASRVRRSYTSLRPVSVRATEGGVG